MLRLGINPLEVLDFLGGWVAWDPLQDDDSSMAVSHGRAADASH